MKHKRILFVLEHFYPYIGGAEKLFYQLSTELVKKGCQVTVLTTRFANDLAKEEIHQGVKIIRITSSNRFSFTFLSLPKVIQLARQHDIVHTSTYNAAFPAVLGGKLVGKKVLVTFHEVWGDLWQQLPFLSFWQKNAFAIFEKILLKLPFDRFIAVSNFTKNELIKQGIPVKKIIRIYNGIEYEDFTQKPIKHSNTPFTFTFFGRLGVSKGLDLLLPAIAELKNNNLAFILKLIIPTVPTTFFQHINNLIDEYDIRSHLTLLHNLPKEQLRQEILTSDCVVIPSYSEGFCFAAAETVAMQIPIISSHQGALQEVVSGQYISMKEQSAIEMLEALHTAFSNNWQQKPMRYFQLKDTILEYLKLYEGKLD